MGYCTPNWISDYFFTNAAQFRRFREHETAGAVGAPTGALAQASVASLVSDPASEVLFSRGIPDLEAWRR